MIQKSLKEREYVFFSGEPRLVEDYETFKQPDKSEIQFAYLRPSKACPHRSCVEVSRLYYLTNDEKLLIVPETELSDEELMAAIQVASKTRAQVSDKPAANAQRKKKEKDAKPKLQMTSEAVKLLGLDLFD